MSKYNFELDMSTNNSNSMILRKVKPNSKVLEIGAAHGRMTKYLKEQLNCDVTIVEIDEEAGKEAATYASRAFIGSELGDVQRDIWSQETKYKEFDYIIFADVLEHLSYPEEVLRTAYDALSDTGSILLSIPNIAHNSVIIDLLNNKFMYRDTGILDKTHLKFFTHSSLKELVVSLGFVIKAEDNAINQVANTEFGNSYDQLPKSIAEYLKSREYGEVYQFVWELTKQQEYKTILSIITPVFNKWNFTKTYLEDMLKLDRNTTEIIVVDNASSDETEVRMQGYITKYPNIKYIKNNINVGFGSANDQALKIASGEYVMFMNNDIKVQSNFDSWHLELIKNCAEYVIVGPTGGKVDPANNFQFMYETNDSQKDINYMSGWCILATRNTWNKIADHNGGALFDNKFFCYFEDTDLSFRAQEMRIEFKLVQIPVVHFGKISSKQLNTYTLYTDSRKIFTEKWKNRKV